MGVQTIGEAYRAGWRIHVRCAWGRRAMKSVRGCLGKAELDLHTLIWRHCVPAHHPRGPAQTPNVRIAEGFGHL
jgi:hypothetical protein